MKNILKLIIFLVLISSIFVTTGCKHDNKTVDNKKGNFDVEDVSLSVDNVDSLVNEIKKAKTADKEDENYYIYDTNNIADLDFIYYPTAEIEGFKLRRIQVNEYYIEYYYEKPEVIEKEAFNNFDFDTGIGISFYIRENETGESMFDAVIEQFGSDLLTEDGYIYDKESRFLIAPVDSTYVFVRVPEEMNDYAVMKELIKAEKIIIE